MVWFYLFFFFKQKTAYEIGWCDWSSDVCSSDLRRVRPDGDHGHPRPRRRRPRRPAAGAARRADRERRPPRPGLTGLALKSLWARKVRALTTTLAVVIGVAFVAGTYILTDTTFAAFDEIFEDSLAKADVVITARDEVRQETGEIPSFSATVLPEARRVDGVRVAAGLISTPGAFFDEENEQIGTRS